MRAVALLVVLASSVASADEFGGWTFTAPDGAQREESGSFVGFTKVTGKTFCKYGLYTARAPSSDDVAFEWKNIVANTFTVKAASKPVTRKAKQLSYTAISATLELGGVTYAGALYVLQPPGAVSSLLVVASDNATLAKCPISGFVDSIALAPVVSSELVGAWGTTAGNIANQYGTKATIRRQYQFKADGTYTYASELFNGVNEYTVVREAGKYTVSGDQLTVAPATSTVTKRDWDKVKSTTKQPLEKVTYSFKKHYFEGIQEWNLILTSGKQTKRDGTYNGTEQFPNAYVLSDDAIEWKFP